MNNTKSEFIAELFTEIAMTSLNKINYTFFKIYLQLINSDKFMLITNILESITTKVS